MVHLTRCHSDHAPVLMELQPRVRENRRKLFKFQTCWLSNCSFPNVVTQAWRQSTRLVETLVVENTSLEEKVKNLEVELSQARTQIERMSSAKLDEVLSVQKPSSDKIGLGYAISSNPSSSTTSRSRIVFVPQSKKGDKGMKFETDLSNSKSFVRLHVCHHCSVSRHIRPDCFKLYPQKQVSKWSQVSSQRPTPLFGELLKAFSFLTQFQENFNSSISFSRHSRTRAFSSSRPKTRVVWVRKEPKT